VEDLMSIAEIEFNPGSYKNKLDERKAQQQQIDAQAATQVTSQ
jgi:hypothetical protein